jgi:hypothetical protein
MRRRISHFQDSIDDSVHTQPGGVWPLYIPMQTVWEMMFTGIGVVMITASVAVIVGMCVLLWSTRKID